MGPWLKKLEQWMGGGPGGTKRVQTFRWLLILGLLGIAAMIFNSFIQVKEVIPLDKQTQSPAPKQDQQVFMNNGKDKDDSLFHTYEAKYESRLKEILEKIIGTGDVDVMVTIDSTEEIVVKQNMDETSQFTDESDESGTKRHITSVTRNGQVVLYQVSGDEKPIVLKTIKPKIRGVLVVAKGAENATVKQMLIQAVQRGLEVPAYRISILPRKS